MMRSVISLRLKRMVVGGLGLRENGGGWHRGGDVFPHHGKKDAHRYLQILN